GPIAKQGRLVDVDNYRGLDALENAERAQKLGAGRGMNAVPFAEAVLAIHQPTRRGALFIRLEEARDAVYLPEMAETPATTSQEQLPERLKSYFQLIVNPEVVRAEYLAYLLNTPLGD